MTLAQAVGDANALLVTGRRHAHVGHDDVRALLLDRGQQRVAVDAAGHDLDPVQPFQDGLQGLAHQERVVRVDHADGAVRGLVASPPLLNAIERIRHSCESAHRVAREPNSACFA